MTPSGSPRPANTIELLPRDGRAILHPNALPPPEGPAAAPHFDILRDALDWREERIKIFGREHAVPRLVAFYGDRAYSYAGIHHPARPMPAPLRGLADRVEELASFRFDCVLANYYRHGADSMGYHRDDEPEIDPGCIASVSFGATRRFRLRHRESREVVAVDLEDGSLLRMLNCQEHWEHGIPKTRRPVEGRINLTFRRTREPLT